ncbi:hypothetical protein UFOVP51_22 [uncultured Caudovirales phage]|uniref:Uncharacterized protein n=1 Tax=uncultured Caudovirales phage TaxID=2100421 RepID=A0A6J5KTA4_9CAUD|nr:hypothetical protein UFOVP51_22 [uncultured Caudovirales phage]CAB4241122.1 hypothetical protein UFOVP34_84 [uncultured Caudovirales phage]
MEKKYTINLGKLDNDPVKFLKKHMKKALEELQTSCSKQDCKKWEELINKIDEYNPNKAEEILDNWVRVKYKNWNITDK